MKTKLKLLSTIAGVLAMTSSVAVAQQGVSDKEVLFGMHTALSGPASIWGVGASNGVRMRFAEVNAKGGVHGRKLKLIVEDHQYLVPKAIQAANKLINKDKIFAMVNSLGTPMNNAVLKRQLQKNVPNLFPFTGARSMHTPFHKLKFTSLSDYYDQIRAGVKYMVEKKGKKKICSFYQDTDFGHEIRDAARDQAKAMGMKVVVETTHTPRDVDFTAQITKLKNAGCDLVAMGTIIKDTIIPVATAKKLGFTGAVFLGSATTYDQFTAGAKGGVTNGFYSATSFEFAYSDSGSDAVKAWAQAYKKKYGKEPNGAAQNGYGSADLIVKTLEATGKDLTVENFVAALEKTKGYTNLFGSPPISFTSDNHKGGSSSLLAIVENGRWKVLEKDISY